MKKLLLVGLMVCAILGSVVSGTLATYTATVDLDDSTITAKAFVLKATQDESYSTSVKLAPGESETFVFTVANYDASSTSEVDINCTVSATVSGELASELTVTKSASTFTLNKNGQNVQIVTVTVEWTDNGQPDVADNAFIGKTATLDISVTGVQA